MCIEQWKAISPSPSDINWLEMVLLFHFNKNRVLSSILPDILIKQNHINIDNIVYIFFRSLTFIYHMTVKLFSKITHVIKII